MCKPRASLDDETPNTENHMRILITGSAGHLGEALMRTLAEPAVLNILAPGFGYWLIVIRRQNRAESSGKSIPRSANSCGKMNKGEFVMRLRETAEAIKPLSQSTLAGAARLSATTCSE